MNSFLCGLALTWTHLMTTLVALNLQSNTVLTDIMSREVACSRCTTSAYSKIYYVPDIVPVAVVVNSLTLTHCQGPDLGYTSVADCCYR